MTARRGFPLQSRRLYKLSCGIRIGLTQLSVLTRTCHPDHLALRVPPLNMLRTVRIASGFARTAVLGLAVSKHGTTFERWIESSTPAQSRGGQIVRRPEGKSTGLKPSEQNDWVPVVHKESGLTYWWRPSTGTPCRCTHYSTGPSSPFQIADGSFGIISNHNLGSTLLSFCICVESLMPY